MSPPARNTRAAIALQMQRQADEAQAAVDAGNEGDDSNVDDESTDSEPDRQRRPTVRFAHVVIRIFFIASFFLA
jgi:hypothetical protein